MARRAVIIAFFKHGGEQFSQQRAAAGAAKTWMMNGCILAWLGALGYALSLIGALVRGIVKRRSVSSMPPSLWYSLAALLAGLLFAHVGVFRSAGLAGASLRSGAPARGRGRGRRPACSAGSDCPCTHRSCNGRGEWRGRWWRQ